MLNKKQYELFFQRLVTVDKIRTCKIVVHCSFIPYLLVTSNEVRPSALYIRRNIREIQSLHRERAGRLAQIKQVSVMFGETQISS